MTTPTTDDALGALMVGVQKFLINLDPESFDALMATVVKARGTEPAPEQTGTNKATADKVKTDDGPAYPAAWGFHKRDGKK